LALSFGYDTINTSDEGCEMNNDLSKLNAMIHANFYNSVQALLGKCIHMLAACDFQHLYFDKEVSMAGARKFCQWTKDSFLDHVQTGGGLLYMITHFPTDTILYIGESGSNPTKPKVRKNVKRLLDHPKILCNNGLELNSNYNWKTKDEGHLGRYKMNDHKQRDNFDIRVKYPTNELGLRVWKTPNDLSKLYESLFLNAYQVQNKMLPILNLGKE
jgi:hypothetical protein